MTAVDLEGWAGRKHVMHLPDGRRLAYVDSGGPGPALLLLHGYTDSSRSFSLMIPRLGGYRLVIPDMPGHGGSAPSEGLRVSDFATDVRALVQALGFERFAIVGHSMGAMIGIDLAARFQNELTSLVTISGTLRPQFPPDSSISREIETLTDPIDPADSFFDDWHACRRAVDAVFLTRMRSEAAAIPAYIWHGILRGFADTDLTHIARQVACPALCIGGSDDALFDAGHRRALADAFENAESIVLEGHGHNPHWEEPAKVAALIVAFLRRETRSQDA